MEKYYLAKPANLNNFGYIRQAIFEFGIDFIPYKNQQKWSLLIPFVSNYFVLNNRQYLKLNPSHVGTLLDKYILKPSKFLQRVLQCE